MRYSSKVVVLSKHMESGAAGSSDTTPLIKPRSLLLKQRFQGNMPLVKSLSDMMLLYCVDLIKGNRK